MYCVPQGTFAGNHYGAYKKSLHGIIGKGDILVIYPFFFLFEKCEGNLPCCRNFHKYAYHGVVDVD